MQTHKIDYFDGNHTLTGTLIYPGNLKEKNAAVLIFPAFEGVGDFSLDYGKKLSEQGYIAFVADMYGNAENSDTLEGCMALYTPFAQDRALVRRRALLAFETLKQQKNVDTQKIGGIGFCFGGTCLLEVVRSGVDLGAAVACHTALAKSNLETHPIQSKLLILNGYADPQVPAVQSLQAFAEEMHQADNDDWIFTFFGNAQHSFTDRRTGSFHPEKEKAMGREYNSHAAEFAFRYAVDFFASQFNLCTSKN